MFPRIRFFLPVLLLLFSVPARAQYYEDTDDFERAQGIAIRLTAASPYGGPSLSYKTGTRIELSYATKSENGKELYNLSAFYGIFQPRAETFPFYRILDASYDPFVHKRLVHFTPLQTYGILQDVKWRIAHRGRFSAFLGAGVGLGVVQFESFTIENESYRLQVQSLMAELRAHAALSYHLTPSTSLLLEAGGSYLIERYGIISMPQINYTLGLQYLVPVHHEY